jgi:hypothetical protein
MRLREELPPYHTPKAIHAQFLLIIGIFGLLRARLLPAGLLVMSTMVLPKGQYCCADFRLSRRAAAAESSRLRPGGGAPKAAAL